MAKGKLYLAGPMRGIANFNFPAFDLAAKRLRKEGWTVFNPAEHDKERYGANIGAWNLTGDETKAITKHGFNLRISLHDDLRFICLEADAIALLPGWENSRGANAEIATAKALGLDVIFLEANYVTH